MFRFIVHASLTELIYGMFILLVVISSAYEAMKDRIKGFFIKERDRMNKKCNNPSSEEQNLHKVDEEIRNLERKMNYRK